MALSLTQREELRKEFSLTEGGHFFTNSQLAQLNNDCVLVVGFGGLGLKGVSAIKTQIERQCADVNKDRIIYRAFDTDKADLIKFSKSDLSQVGLELDIEAVHLKSGVSDITLPDPVTYNKLPSNIKQWLPSSLNPGIELKSDGAGGVRQAGRLLFSYTGIAKIVSDNLRQAIHTLGVKSNNISVIFLAGIGGGTGAGSFVDAAYLMRDPSVRGTANLNISSYLFMPDVLSKKPNVSMSNLRRNTYASLRELDYFMNLKRHLIGNTGDSYSFQYADASIGTNGVVSSGENIFDSCTLVCGTPGDGGIATFKDPEQQALNTVANTVVASLTASRASANGTQTMLSSVMSNSVGDISAAVNTFDDESFPKNSNFIYRAIGYGSQQMPLEECITYVADKLFDSMCKFWQRRPGQPDVDKLINQYGLYTGALMNQIEAVPARIATLNPDLNALKNELIAKSPMQLDFELKQNVEQYALNLRNAKDALIGRILYGTKEMPGLFPGIEEMLHDPQRGPFFTVRVLAGETEGVGHLLKVLEDQRRALLNQYNQLKAQQTAINVSNVQPTRVIKHNAFKEALIKNTNKLTEARDAYTAYWRNEAEIHRMEIVLSIFDVLYGEVSSLTNNIYDVYTSVINETRTILHDNASIITDADLRNEAAQSVFTWKMIDLARTDAQTRNLKAYLDDIAQNYNMISFMGTFTGMLLNNGPEWQELSRRDKAGELAQKIREFLAQSFSNLITLNLDSFISTAYGSGNDAVAAQTIYDELVRSSAPVFATSDVQVGFGAGYAQYSYVSIPASATTLRANLSNLIRATTAKVQIFDSSIESEVVWFKLYQGLPAYALKQIKDCEVAYYDALNAGQNGFHLDQKYYEFPDPLNPGAWKYFAPYNRQYQETGKREEMNALVDTAMKYGIIYEAIDPATGSNAFYTISTDYSNPAYDKQNGYLTANLQQDVIAKINEAADNGTLDVSIPRNCFKLFAQTAGNTADVAYDVNYLHFKVKSKEDLALDLRGSLKAIEVIKKAIDVYAPVAKAVEAKVAEFKMLQELRTNITSFIDWVALDVLVDNEAECTWYYDDGMNANNIALDYMFLEYPKQFLLLSLYKEMFSAKNEVVREILKASAQAKKTDMQTRRDREAVMAYNAKKAQLKAVAHQIRTGRNADNLELGAIGIDNALLLRNIDAAEKKVISSFYSSLEAMAN